MSSETYEVLPGVEWVNGKPVPENREVVLTPIAASFDLAQGRIRKKSQVAALVFAEVQGAETPKAAAPSKKA